MMIVAERPPMWAEIVAAFPRAALGGVIFSWGDRIYNPDSVVVTPALLAHEAVHGERQLAAGLQSAGGVEAWWALYLRDPAFRLAEEIPAHVEEVRVACAGKTRHARRSALSQIAHRLASPLYGRLLTLDKAEALLRRALKEPA